jgi:hypothetical protein
MFLSDHHPFIIFVLTGCCLLFAKELINFFQGKARRLMIGYLAWARRQVEITYLWEFEPQVYQMYDSEAQENQIIFPANGRLRRRSQIDP